MRQRKKIGLIFLGCLGWGISQMAFAKLTVSPYGSLRMQLETVAVDQAVAGEDASYQGIRDAYSRLGIKADYPIDATWDLKAQLEFPVNIQTLQAEDPAYFQGFYKQNNSPRIGQLTVNHSQLGTVAFGMQWLAYYNHIGAPLDYFSSFYSGYATYATFRREALTYTTPQWHGVQLTASAVDMIHRQDSAYLDTLQWALSFQEGDLSIGLGYEQQPQSDPSLWGISATYQLDQWYLATKFEQYQTTGSGTDNPVLKTILLSYQLPKWTFKGRLSAGDSDSTGTAFFQGNSYQLEADYQVNADLKLFLNYFYEQNSYAILKPNAQSFDTLSAFGTESNGRVFSVGLGYDF